MDEYTPLTAATRSYIEKDYGLIDCLFQAGPASAAVRKVAEKAFPGSDGYIEVPFMYSCLNGGPMAAGEKVNLNEKQIEDRFRLSLKRLAVNITLDKVDIQVFNKGPQAIFSLVKTRVKAAYMTMSAFIEIAMFLNGSRTNYTKNMNGLPEIVNDGSNSSWDGQAYTTYGERTRSNYGTSLNGYSPAAFTELTYENFEDLFAGADYGSEFYSPNLVISTRKAYSYLKNRYQTQQRFPNTTSPDINMNGMKFEGATIVKSRYCPGSWISANSTDPVVTTFIKQMSDDALTAYPTVTGETIWCLNARKPHLLFYVTDDKEFGFGLSGWKPSQGGTDIVCQLWALCQIAGVPRYHSQGSGFSA